MLLKQVDKILLGSPGLDQRLACKTAIHGFPARR